MPTQPLPAIALLAEDASLRMGPDAARAYQYFRCLRERGLDVHLVTQARHREELLEAFVGDEDRVHCVADPASALRLARLALLLPPRLRELGDAAARLVRQRARRRATSQLVRRRGVRIVHQVTPAAPKGLSRIEGLGVPVVMGPLLARPERPPGFRPPGTPARRALDAARGLLSGAILPLLHRLLAGRREADVLLVANARSSRAVPRGARGRKLRLAAEAIEVREWKAQERAPGSEAVELLFPGPLTPDSGADLLLDAFRLTLDATPARLQILGEGPERRAIEQRIEALDLGAHVTCSGWLEPAARHAALERAEVVVLPSLDGGDPSALMQAMCLGIPVVASDWGSMRDYAGDGAGLLVGPRTRQQFVHELANVMHRLAASPALRREVGTRGQRRAESEFDWSQRIDRLVDVYRLLAREERDREAPAPRSSDMQAAR